MVAGSNPVSPTSVIAGERRFRSHLGPPRLLLRGAVRQRVRHRQHDKGAAEVAAGAEDVRRRAAAIVWN